MSASPAVPFTAVDWQPFMRLFQKNMTLLTRFTLSPEVLSQAAAAGQAVAERVPEAAARVAASGAWSDLVQGMVRNYTEFMAELAQSTLGALAQAPAAALEPAADALAPAAATARSPRTRS